MKLFCKIIIWLLSNRKIESEDKTLVLNALLKNMNVVPIRDVIHLNEKGLIVINGKEQDSEQSMYVLQGCQALRDNKTRRLIRDQITYEATKIGIHHGMTPESIQFSKATIWWGQQEERILTSLLGE